MQKTITIDVPGPKTMAEFKEACKKKPGEHIPTLHEENVMLKGLVEHMEAEHARLVDGFRLLREKPPATSPQKAPEATPTASAPAPAPATAPTTPDTFSTQASALAAYNALDPDDARGREVFRAKHARVLGLGAGDSEAANEVFKTRAEAEAAYRRLDQSDAYALEDFRKAHARILGLTRTSGGSGFNR